MNCSHLFAGQYAVSTKNAEEGTVLSEVSYRPGAEEKQDRLSGVGASENENETRHFTSFHGVSHSDAQFKMSAA